MVNLFSQNRRKVLRTQSPNGNVFYAFSMTILHFITTHCYCLYKLLQIVQNSFNWELVQHKPA